MGIVKADISVSLDGFVTGPNDSVELGLGEGGERLHEWIVQLESWRQLHGMEGGESGRESDILQETFANSGAFIMGRRMFDHGLRHWGDEPAFRQPVFVLSHRGGEPLKKGDTTFLFATTGVQDAVTQAKASAGDRDVAVVGGASVIQQMICAGLLDELQIHIVPILMGGGQRLFANIDPQLDFETVRVEATPGATHIKLRPVYR